MNRSKRSFSDASLAQFRAMSLKDACSYLGCYWKEDPDFVPIKDPVTKRVFISNGSRVFEILVTSSKWFDSRFNRGGGGAIDLVMYLFGLDFVGAVNLMQKRIISTAEASL